jgi:hypothetical protein
MASLRKFPRSPFWFACFTLPDGKRVQRSTKEKKRKDAQTKADSWEKLSKERAKARQSHKVIADIYRAAIRRGEVKRQPCSQCGGLGAHAHHDDYSKPLEVTWLCRWHHHEHHRKGRKYGRGQFLLSFMLEGEA